MVAAAIPQGPRGGRLLGNMREFNSDSLGFVERCAREFGDVVPTRFLYVPALFLFHPDQVEYVLATGSKNFIKAASLRSPFFHRLVGNGLLTSEGEFWRRQRRLAQPAFHRKRVAAYGEVMVALAERSLEAWRDGQTIDVHEEMMHLTLEIVAKCLFDADVGSRATDVGKAMKVALKDFSSQRRLVRIPRGVPTPRNIRFELAARRLDDIVRTIIEDRRKSREDRGDLLSMLMLAEDEGGGRMTDKQLRDEVMTLFLAGHETTANALSWTFWLLSQTPHDETRL